MKEDRLSILPVTILHDILSRLSHKCAVRTSVLSRAWAETWSTFPLLSFSDTKIIGKKRKNFTEFEDYPLKKKKLCEYIGRRMLRFCKHRMSIKKFKLKMYNFQDMSKNVDLWLKLASESGVELLDLCQHYNDCKREEIQDQCYIFPMSTIIEAKSLTVLELSGRIRIDLTVLENHQMTFFSLKVLSLDNVCFGDEESLKHFITCCPLIEYLNLRACSVYPSGDHLHHAKNSWVKSLSLYGLKRLKSVNIQGMQKVHVDSQCLENLDFVPGDSSSSAAVEIEFDRCKNLRWLTLVFSKNTIITDKKFLGLFIKFPWLEILRFGSCRMPEKINISSDQLKKLVLYNCLNLKEVNIEAPNLLSFSYLNFGNHDVKPIISFQRYSSQLVVSASICVNVVGHNRHNIEEFVRNIKPQTVSTLRYLTNHEMDAVELDPMVLQLSSPPPSIEHVILENVPNNETLYPSLVNRLLSSCCPSTIWLILESHHYTRAFIELLYETLSGTNKDEFVYKFGHTKCWWHDLKGVRVTSSIKIGESVDFKTMLDTWQNSAQRKIVKFKLQF